MLAALATALTLTAVAAAGPDAAKRSYTFTENGVRFSFNVAPRPPGAFHPVKSIATDKLPGGPISLNKDVCGAQSAEGIIYWTSFPDGDYADPCARLLSPSTGASAAKLATAVARAPGTRLVKGPADVTLGGRPAKHVVLTVRKKVGCDPGFFFTWRAVDGGTLWTRTGAGATIRVWIVDRERDAPLHRSHDEQTCHPGPQEGDPAGRRIDSLRLAMSDFHHGHEPRAEEIALHQKYLTLEGQIDAARLEGDEAEARRLTPLVKRAKARWIKANRRVTRGS